MEIGTGSTSEPIAFSGIPASGGGPEQRRYRQRGGIRACSETRWIDPVHAASRYPGIGIEPSLTPGVRPPTPTGAGSWPRPRRRSRAGCARARASGTRTRVWDGTMIGTNETYATIASALFDENKRQQAEVAGLIKRLELSAAALDWRRARGAYRKRGTTGRHHDRKEVDGRCGAWRACRHHVQARADIGPRKFLASSLIAIGLGLAAMVWTAGCSCRMQTSWPGCVPTLRR